MTKAAEESLTLAPRPHAQKYFEIITKKKKKKFCVSEGESNPLWMEHEGNEDFQPAFSAWVFHV